MGNRLIDLSGKRFGLWTVIERAPNSKDGRAAWVCRCECGNTKAINTKILRRGSSKSCGCATWDFLRKNRPSRLIDMKGQRFGRLTVLERAPDDNRQQPMWYCRCDCGAVKPVKGYALRTGRTQSCGCASGLIRSAKKRKNLLGQTFDRLTVLRYAGGGMWHCRCVCGNEKKVATTSLTSRETRSCGCLAREFNERLKRYRPFKDTLSRFRSDPEYAATPAYLYLVEVDNMSILKIGVSIDPARRGRKSFTSTHYQRALPRACCRSVEQTALWETRAHEPLEVPEGITLTSGLTELREGLDVQETIRLLDSLADRCERIGWEAMWAELEARRKSEN